MKKEPQSDGPTILALSESEGALQALRDGASARGMRLLTAADLPEISFEALDTNPLRGLTEPLIGPLAAFVEWLTRSRPSLALVDVTSGFPWERWIAVMKTSAATRRIPVLAFGPAGSAGLERAHALGANGTLPSNALLDDLHAILERWTMPDSRAELRAACRRPLPEHAREGLRLHNAGRYFEAHEAFEEAWMEAGEPSGRLYRALLQISVAYLHLERGNRRGAQKMLLRMRQWLDPLPDRCQGVEIASLKAGMDRLRKALQDREVDLGEIARTYSVRMEWAPENKNENGRRT